MNANEIVNVLRACGNGNSVCEKCPFYIREDSNECRFNAIYESADIIEAQQQEINLLIMEITELRESNQALKDYAENADADKDEQAGQLRRMDNGVKRLKISLQWLAESVSNPIYKAWAKEKIQLIDAMLGGCKNV